MESNMNPIKELSLINYTTIAILERLGLSNPSLEQIDIMESMVLMATHPQQIEPETIRQCVGDNNLAYYFLFIKANEGCKVKDNKEIPINVQNQIMEKVAL
jgi:hypothetical protein